ncbi:calcium-binding protein [Chitinimonas arctica]|uniref:calcium-binding protein n=1 Tax=Chitinimonas arctica TaxID=2594795 RepID=UPI0015D289AF|nr:calcium-binding protein [Chitinimonas arctica]
MDINAYMDDGPGRFASPALFSLLIRFFDPSFIDLFSELKPGSYTKAQLAAHYGFDSYGLSIAQSDYDDGKDDYFQRAYVWESGAFKINDEAKFIVDANHNRYIENFAVIPKGPENFDFESDSLRSKLANFFLERNIDPSGIGRKVEINWSGTRILKTKFTKDDYWKAHNNLVEPLHSPISALAAGYDNFMANLFAEGSNMFLDDRMKPVIYSAQEGGEIDGYETTTGVDIDGLKELGKFVRNGIVYIGADGKDDITGEKNDDELRGYIGNDKLSGEGGDDTLDGGEGDDELHGGTGKDKLKGGADKDKLHGDEGDDELDGEAGDDELHGGDDKDKLKGGADNDKLHGDEGDDELDGEAGNDELHGGKDKDKLKGGADNDKLHGDEGDDELEGGAGADELHGGADKDKLKGDSEADKLYGDGGNDELDGGSGADVLVGGADNDVLEGGEGMDILWGSSESFEADGADILKGGAGLDIYRASVGDTIIDTDGQGIVRLRQRYIDGAWRKKGETAYSSWDKKFTFTVSGSTLVVSSAEGALTIQNWSNGQLDIRLSETDKELPTKPPFDPNRTRAQIDPLVLDLNHDGVIQTIGSYESSVYFDFNKDQIAERSGWISAEDGMLVSDDNKNGFVDNLGELFGNATEDGFSSLRRRYDDNQDGVVDRFDSHFSDLLVWQDANQDGVSQAGELKTLAQLGVSAISTRSTEVNIGSKDNRIAATSVFVQDGQDHLAADVQLAVDFALTDSNPARHLDEEMALDDAVITLPRLRGFGAVRDLAYACQADKGLLAQVQALIESGRGAVEDGFEGMLAKWSGLDAAYQRHGMARQGALKIQDKVWILESLSGIDVNKSLIEQNNFWSSSTMRFSEQYIAERFRFIVDRMEMSFSTQAFNKDWLAGVFYSVEQDRFDAYQPTAANDSLATKLGQAASYEDAVAMARLLARFKADRIPLDIERLRGIAATLAYPEPITFALDGGFALGGRGQDVLIGTSEHGNWLDGVQGNDTLRGGSGADLIHGGTGNDSLEGGSGNDRYLFAQGDGQDIIRDQGYALDKIDSIRFGAGISALATRVRRHANDLVLTFGDGGDAITVQHFFYDYDNGASQIERFEFSDGTVWDVAAINALVIVPTQESDELYGYAGNDSLVGLAGNDTLYGKGGDDTLNGGVGNDSLLGGAGSDLYLFKQGDGEDTISEYASGASNTDTISLGEGLNVAATSVTRKDGDLILSFGDGSDRLIVSNYFYGDAAGGNQIEHIRFADGTDWTPALIKEMVRRATAGDDLLYGYATDDLIAGLAGHDQLFGANGNDTLNGGLGNDTLQGGAGSDIYQFARGDGNDILLDHSEWKESVDVLRLGSGIKVADTRASRNGDALRLDFGQNDSILVSDFFIREGTSATQLERIEFVDGTVWDIAAIKLQVLKATEGADSLVGYTSDDSIAGAGGNDSLHGEMGRDTLRGGAGDDYLIGGGGDDLLEGGSGSDLLQGGGGADRYQFSRGDGTDRIVDFDPGNMIDVVSLGGDFTTANTRAKRVGDDLRLSFANSSDSITIDGYFGNDGTNGSQIERIEFSNGDSWDVATVKLMVIQASADADEIHGYENAEQLAGLAGDDKLHGHGGDDTVLGGTGRDTLLGDGGNDSLSGDDGDDVLDGSVGNDTLDGGSGADRLVGGEGNDVYLFGQGSGQDVIENYDGSQGRNDVIRFKAGVLPADVRITRTNSDLIASLNGGVDSVRVARFFDNEGAGNSRIDRFEFADGSVWNIDAIKAQALKPSEGADSLYGYVGNDSFGGGLGNDLLHGFDGDDTLAGDAGDDLLLGQLGSDHLDGGEGNDSLAGALGNDTLLGGAGDDTLDGGEGDDSLEGGGGIDGLAGGLGDDRYIVSALGGQVRIDDSAGADILQMQFEAAQLMLRREGNDLVIHIVGTEQFVRVANQFFPQADGLGSNGVESIVLADGTRWNMETIKKLVLVSTDGDDTIQGHPGNDAVSGGAGHDVLMGGEGNDTLLGEAGNDHLFGEGGSNQLEGGSGDDTLEGGWEGDALLGGDGSDELLGGGGLDSLNGDEGDDRLDGGSEQDRLSGGAGNDALLGGDGDDTLRGDDGDDLLQGGGEGDRLEGGDGNDSLQGNGGADTLLGGAGDDELVASDDVWQREGNYLEGGRGNDTLYGSYGDDQYGFSLGDGKDLLIETRPDEAFNNIDASQDTLVFGAGITTADIGFFRIGFDLVIRHTNGADEITVQNWFGNIATDHFKLDSVVFHDGATLDLAGIEARVITLGTAQADTLMGYRGNADDIRAGAGNDKLFGFSGNDKLSGEDGDDTVMGGNGMAGQTGDDSLYGGIGRDNLFGEDGNDLLMGEAGDDYLEGGLGNDLLQGGTENDQLSGGEGDDQLQAGAGNDKYVFTGNWGKDVIDNAGGGSDWLFFSELERAQLSFKQEGKDLLIGVVGDATRTVRVLNHFNGGAAAIAYVQPKGGNALSATDIASLLGGGGTITGTAGNDNLSGTAQADLMAGGTGNDTLFGQAGNDTVRGEVGDDYLDGGTGNDSLEGGTGKDQLTGGEGDDRLLGGSEDDKYVFTGNWGKDVIDNTGGGSDWLFFSELEKAQLSFKQEGQDLVIGVVGDANRTVRVLNHFSGGAAAIAYLQPKSGNALSAADIARLLPVDPNPPTPGTGGSGPANPADFNQVKEGTANADQLSGGPTKDLLRGLGGDDQLFGGAGNDRLEGGDGNDYLSGGYGSGNSGDDLLIGGAGDDQLNGEDGNDRLEGGAGNDSYVFDGASQDVIDNSGGGSDGIFLADGIGAARLSFQRDGDDLLVVVDKQLTTSLRVLKHFKGGEMAIAYVQPSGGNMFTAATIAQMVAAQTIPGGYETLQDGDANGNKLTGAASRDLLRGLGGDDTLFGGLGNDRLEGGDGNDYLSGGYGNVANTGDDILVGGAGSDTLNGEDGKDRLEGEAGNDFYMLAKGAGADVIKDFDATANNSDTVQFKDVKSTEVTAVQKAGVNLVLKYGATDQLTVENYFDATNAVAYRVERFTFSDSVVWTNTQIQAKAVTVAGLQAAALPRPPMVETVSVDQQLASLVSAMAGFSPMDAAQWQQTVPGHEMHVPLMTANRLM